MYTAKGEQQRKQCIIGRSLLKVMLLGLTINRKILGKLKASFLISTICTAKKYDSVILVANSIGAYFSMNALAEKNISQAMFISPIVNMERLIADMMMWSNVTEAELESKKELPTEFGETLSWEYLCYVRKHPIKWNIPTCILYGANDNLTSVETVSGFAEQIGASLTVMNDGEHWFHTNEQMEFLDNWIRNSI